jgi:hypothetical protein
MLLKKNIIRGLSTVLISSVFIACGGKGDSSTSNNAYNNPEETPVSYEAIQGSVGKGKLLDGTVSLYKADGTLLGTDTTIVDGKYEIANPTGYSGAVKAVADFNTYRDEMLAQDVNASGLQLSAVGTINPTVDNGSVLNITAITELASRVIPLDSISESDANQILQTNKYVAQTMGIENYDPSKDDVEFVESGAGTLEDTPLHRNSLVLLSISKESNLSVSDNDSQVVTKVETALDKYYQSFIRAVNDDNITELETMVEDLNGTNTELQDKEYEDIIDSNRVVSNTLVDPVVATLVKTLNYADNQGNTTPTKNEVENLGLKFKYAGLYGNFISDVATKGKNEVDSIPELKNLVRGLNVNKAVEMVSASGNDGNVSLEDFQNTELDINASNVDSYNEFLASNDINASDLNTSILNEIIEAINSINNGEGDLNASAIASLGLDDDISDSEALGIFNAILGVAATEGNTSVEYIESLAQIATALKDDVNANDANELALFNSFVPAVDGNNTAANLEALAQLAARLADVIDGTTVLPVVNPADYLADLTKVAVTPAVTSENIHGYLQMLQTDGNATSITHLGTTSSTQKASLSVIAQKASDNNASSNPALTQTSYTFTGLTNAETTNVNLYNEYLDTNDINGSDVDTYTKLKSYVGLIDDLANGTALLPSELNKRYKYIKYIPCITFK